MSSLADDAFTIPVPPPPAVLQTISVIESTGPVCPLRILRGRISFPKLLEGFCKAETTDGGREIGVAVGVKELPPTATPEEEEEEAALVAVEMADRAA